MNEEIRKRIEKLFSEGKISEEEKNRLLEIMISKKLDSEESAEVKDVQIQGLKSNVVRVEGVDGLKKVMVKNGAGSVEISEENGKVIISPISAKVNFGFIRIGGSYDMLEVQVPRTLNTLEVRLVSSDIVVRNVSAKVSISVVSGDCTVEKVTGEASVSGVSSDITASDVDSIVAINTKSGDISIRNSTITSRLKTYSGDIEIEESHIRGCEISTYSGDINVSKSVFESSSTLNAVFGDIELDFNPATSRVVAETAVGEVEANGVPLSRSGSMYFAGKGAIDINVRTKSGDIYVETISKEDKDE